MWREVNALNEVDYALSFQEASECQKIWDSIGNIQRQYLQQNEYGVSPSFGTLFSRQMAANKNTEIPIEDHLPEPSKSNIMNIRNFLSNIPNYERENTLKYFHNNNFSYLSSLLKLFDIFFAENEIVSLKILAEVWRFVILINDYSIVSFIVEKSNFIILAGIFDFDPSLNSRGCHQEFIFRKANFREIIPMENELLKTQIQKLFYLKYLKDYLIRPLVDETGAAAIYSCIANITLDICTHIFCASDYIDKILNLSLSLMKDNDLENNHFVDCLRFMRELFYMSRILYLDKRYELYCIFLQKYQEKLFQVVMRVFYSPAIVDSSNSTVCETQLLTAEILSCLVLTCSSEIRQFIIAGPVPQNINSIIRRENSESNVIQESNAHSLLFVILFGLVNSSSAPVIEYLADAVKCLLDPDSARPTFIEQTGTENAFPTIPANIVTGSAKLKREMDKFLALFYDFYVHALLLPFAEGYYSEFLNESLKIQDIHTLAQSRKCLIEILSCCVRCHSFRMKYFVIRSHVFLKFNSFIPSIMHVARENNNLQLIQVSRNLELYIIKFWKNVFMSRDEFYFRHVIKFDLMKELFRTLNREINQHCTDNLLISAIIELLDFIRSANISSLIIYITEKYLNRDKSVNEANIFSVSCFEDTFSKFKVRYDQIMNSELFGAAHGGDTMEISSSSLEGLNNTLKRKRDQKFREIGNEEAYFESDEDDANSRDIDRNQANFKDSLFLIQDLYNDYDEQNSDDKKQQFSFGISSSDVYMERNSLMKPIRNSDEDYGYFVEGVDKYQDDYASQNNQHFDDNNIVSSPMCLPPMKPKFEQDDENFTINDFLKRAADYSRTKPTNIVENSTNSDIYNGSILSNSESIVKSDINDQKKPIISFTLRKKQSFSSMNSSFD